MTSSPALLTAAVRKRCWPSVGDGPPRSWIRIVHGRLALLTAAVRKRCSPKVDAVVMEATAAAVDCGHWFPQEHNGVNQCGGYLGERLRTKQR